MLLRPFVAALFVCVFAPVAPAGDWTQFRGPGSNGISDEKDLPIKWNNTDNLRWKAELPGRGLSSPVVAAGRVYVTASSGYQQKRLHVLCFDAASGKKLWERQFWATGDSFCHPKTSMAAPTPATDGERVYCLFATCDLVCLDRDGNLVWLRSLCRDYPTITNQVGMAASPVLYRDLLLVQMENAGESFITGIDKKTGKNRWKFDRESNLNWTTPVIFNDGKRDLVLFQSPGELTAHEPETGKKVWTYEGKGIAGTPSTVVGGGYIFVPGEELAALKPAGDKAPTVAWTAAKLRPATSSPLYHKDRIYALGGAGVLNCGDAANGKVLWQERLKGPFSSSPVVADGKLYAVNEAGTTFVVELGEKPRVLADNALGETILCTPAISGGAIFLRSDQHLYCIGAKK